MNHINEFSEFKKSLNEGPGKGYYIKVAVRDAKKALAILDDMYRKKFDINGSDTYYFKDEDMAYDAMMDLGARDIEVTDTNIEESLDEKVGPCWDGYKIGSPKTKISSQSGKRVNNCVPIDESVTEAKMSKEKIESLIWSLENEKDSWHPSSASKKKSMLDKLKKDLSKFESVNEDKMEAFGLHRMANNVGQEVAAEFLLNNNVDLELITKAIQQGTINKYELRDIVDGTAHKFKVKQFMKQFVNEATDLNDPVLMAIRRMKSEMEKRKSLPKLKKTTIKQYFTLMDKEIDLIDQMKDATREFEQLDSDMNADAGQKGEDWTDADANRYGGDLDKLQTKIEKLAKQKAKVKLAIINYRMNY